MVFSARCEPQPLPRRAIRLAGSGSGGSRRARPPQDAILAWRSKCSRPAGLRRRIVGVSLRHHSSLFRQPKATKKDRRIGYVWGQRHACCFARAARTGHGYYWRLGPRSVRTAVVSRTCAMVAAARATTARLGGSQHLRRSLLLLIRTSLPCRQGFTSRVRSSKVSQGPVGSGKTVALCYEALRAPPMRTFTTWRFRPWWAAHSSQARWDPDYFPLNPKARPPARYDSGLLWPSP